MMHASVRIGHRTVLILIDSGSTHNFVNQKVVQALGLPVTPITKFWVIVANGERLSCTKNHEGVGLVIQGMAIIVTLFALSLNGLDNVLGIQWLEKLGPVVCDWGQLSMIISTKQGHAISNSMMTHEVDNEGRGLCDCSTAG